MHLAKRARLDDDVRRTYGRYREVRAVRNADLAPGHLDGLLREQLVRDPAARGWHAGLRLFLDAALREERAEDELLARGEVLERRLRYAEVLAEHVARCVREPVGELEGLVL